MKYISSQTDLARPVLPLSTLSELIGRDELFADLEADGLDPYRLYPYLLGIYDRQEYYIVDLTSYSETEIQQALEPLLGARWVFHNVNYDWKLLACRYRTALSRIWCTMLSSQVLYNGMDLSHSLDACLERHFGVKLDKSGRSSFINRDKAKPIEDGEIEYLVNDLRYLPDLYDRHRERAEKWKLIACIELENQYLPIISQVELEGIRLDREKWLVASQEFARQADEALTQLRGEVERLSNLFPDLLGSEISLKPKKRGKYEAESQLNLFSETVLRETISESRVIEKFNVNSTQQIQAIYNRCGAPQITQTGEDLLQQYLIDNPNSELRRFTELLLQYRGMAKLVSTYGENFFAFINPVTGRIHTSYSQCFTDTGRLSSGSPNLQNIPNLDELRSCFVPDSEDYVFVDCDFSGQELRLAASNSQDPMLMASFTDGLDLHSYLAQGSYRIITGNPNLIVSKSENKKYRNDHKPVLFGVLYGAGPGSIAGTLNIDMPTAKRVYQNILNSLPELSRYQQGIKQQGVRTKSVRDGTKYNRVKWFNQHVKKLKEDHQIERQACNFPIQAGAASMAKEAGIELDRYFRTNNLDCKIKLQVHDEYLVQIPKAQPELGLEIKRIMEEVGSRYLIGIRMESELMTAPCWAH
ncbi:DNA polymerase I-like protein with 3'-5' exonuclease and polymerase domains [Spirosoma oryzae]|uniref:DNA polymerase I n=1 Tax=Spirosoma oryzae TaxID=1469603 RepID=A0A2T0SKD0_9BACT|nr:DNA polymerase [Spirosoma oryzae]PRY33864.1 DNA polymerase I-like protein with 3'-5' exonuclease and polymerase domains [Spirosoma oryzae]